MTSPKRRRTASTAEQTEILHNTTRELHVLQKLLPGASSSLPIFIVEEHSEALLCLQRAMRRGVLPLHGISLLHYDAHPDLCLPQHLTSDLVYSPPDLLETLRNTESGIAEWVMPLVFAGHINHIVWIRSAWSNQLADGAYHLKVGEAVVSHTSPSEQYLVVDCKAPYFANDGMNAAVSSLKSVKSFALHVTAALNTCSLAHFPPAKPAVCLDICLDFFSTLNPFLEQLKTTVPSSVVNSVQHFCAEFTLRQQNKT